MLRPLAVCCALVSLLSIGCKGPLQAVTRSRVTTVIPPQLDTGPLIEMSVVPGDVSSGEKIALIDVDGLLLNTDMTGMGSMGENPVALFREKLDRVAGDRCYRAVVVRINSYGGAVTATDIMWQDLQSFKARTGLPVVVSLMDVGAGGAYYLATAADHVFAHPTTVTGGIGVILNTYNLQDALAQFNVSAIPVKAGNYIDMGSPVRAPTEEALDQAEEARELLKRMAADFHDRFQGIVRHARPRLDPNRPEVFDGRVFTAQHALELGLIDSIGYVDDAIAMARQLGGVPSARVVLLHRCLDRARTPYNITPNIPTQTALIPLSIPGIERSKLPTFLYLWQPEPTMERLVGR
jgi:protease-4